MVKMVKAYSCIQPSGRPTLSPFLPFISHQATNGKAGPEGGGVCTFCAACRLPFLPIPSSIPHWEGMWAELFCFFIWGGGGGFLLNATFYSKILNPTNGSKAYAHGEPPPPP